MTARSCMTMLLTSLITAGWAHHAAAQPTPVPLEANEETAPRTRRKFEYYGWQILLTDVTSGLLVFGSGYALGGPIVHLSHGNPGRALGSAALRVGLFALAVAAMRSEPEACEGGDDYYDDTASCGDGAVAEAWGMIMLGTIGAGVVSLLDWTALSLTSKEVPVKPAPALVPQVSAGADGSLRFGVLGRF